MPKIEVSYTYSNTFKTVLDVSQETLDKAGGIDSWDPSDWLDPSFDDTVGWGDLEVDDVTELPDA